MKKYYPLLFAFIALIIRCLYFWFSDEIYDKIFIFELIPFALTLLVVSWAIYYSFSKLPSDKSWINIVASIISIFSLLFIFFIPFREIKTKLELKTHEKEMMEVIEMVKNNELEGDDIGNYDLPDKYRKLSKSGQVYVYQNDENGQVIGFWVFRGLINSGSYVLVYSTGGEELIKSTERYIVEIKKFKDNWYYLNID